jgi:ribosome-binding ATPase
VRKALEEAALTDKTEWSDEDCDRFARRLRGISKPIIIAANKIDQGKANYDRLKDKYGMVPVCAEAELALREADKHGLIEYIPGDGSFKVAGDLDEKRKKGLDYINERILKAWGSTGAQDVLNRAVLGTLQMMTVYPVENENRLADGKGAVLPDSFLLPKDSTALDMAYKIHTDIGAKFIGAIDARTKMKVGKDHRLKDGDVIKIIAGR